MFITPLLLVKTHHTTPSLMFGAASNTTNDRLNGSFWSVIRKRSSARVTFGGTAEGAVDHIMANKNTQHTADTNIYHMI